VLGKPVRESNLDCAVTVCNIKHSLNVPPFVTRSVETRIDNELVVKIKKHLKLVDLRKRYRVSWKKKKKKNAGSNEKQEKWAHQVARTDCWLQTLRSLFKGV
jgi:transposase